MLESCHSITRGDNILIFPLKFPTKIFLIVFGKFPVFSLYGKIRTQNHRFPCVVFPVSSCFVDNNSSDISGLYRCKLKCDTGNVTHCVSWMISFSNWDWIFLKNLWNPKMNCCDFVKPQNELLPTIILIIYYRCREYYRKHNVAWWIGRFLCDWQTICSLCILFR